MYITWVCVSKILNKHDHVGVRILYGWTCKTSCSVHILFWVAQALNAAKASWTLWISYPVLTSATSSREKSDSTQLAKVDQLDPNWFMANSPPMRILSMRYSRSSLEIVGNRPTRVLFARAHIIYLKRYGLLKRRDELGDSLWRWDWGVCPFEALTSQFLRESQATKNAHFLNLRQWWMFYRVWWEQHELCNEVTCFAHSLLR